MVDKKRYPYFDYLFRKYSHGENYVEIPMLEGSRTIDNHLIKPLLEEGWIYKSSFLLGQIYLFRKEK